MEQRREHVVVLAARVVALALLGAQGIVEAAAARVGLVAQVTLQFVKARPRARTTQQASQGAAAAGGNGRQRAAAGGSGRQRAAAGGSARQRAAAGGSGRQWTAVDGSGRQRAAGGGRTPARTD